MQQIHGALFFFLGNLGILFRKFNFQVENKERLNYMIGFK